MATNIPIVATMNQKGGVGKSTIAGTQAEWFAIVRKKRVCLVDLDEQCNTTKQFIGVEYINDDTEAGFQIKEHPDYSPDLGVNKRSSIADIFYGESVLPYQSWITEDSCKGGLVDVLCGHPVRIEEINNAFLSKEDKINTNAKSRLKEFFEMEEIQEAYDVFLLDTGPSKNVMFRSALHAATHVVVPFEPEDKAIQGITQMLNAIKRENFTRNRNHQLHLAGLLPNKVRKNLKLHSQYLKELSDKYESYMFPWPCRLSLLTDFPTRDRVGARPKSIFQLPLSNPARAQATAMCLYLEKKIFGNHLGITKEIKQVMSAFENGIKALGINATCRI